MYRVTVIIWTSVLFTAGKRWDWTINVDIIIIILYWQVVIHKLICRCLKWTIRLMWVTSDELLCNILNDMQHFSLESTSLIFISLTCCFYQQCLGLYDTTNLFVGLWCVEIIQTRASFISMTCGKLKGITLSDLAQSNCWLHFAVKSFLSGRPHALEMITYFLFFRLERSVRKPNSSVGQREPTRIKVGSR